MLNLHYYIIFPVRDVGTERLSNLPRIEQLRFEPGVTLFETVPPIDSVTLLGPSVVDTLVPGRQERQGWEEISFLNTCGLDICPFTLVMDSALLFQ